MLWRFLLKIISDTLNPDVVWAPLQDNLTSVSGASEDFE